VRIKSVMTLVMGTAMTVALAAPAFAQARPAAPAAKTSSMSSSSDSAADFGIGYSFLHIANGNAPAGFDVYYAKDMKPMSSGSLGFVVDASVNHGDGSTLELVTGGVRASFKGSAKAKFYAQVTGGLAHAFEESKFVVDFGGGIKLPMEGKKFGVFAQVDFPIVFFTGSTEKGFRINVGVTFPVGK